MTVQLPLKWPTSVILSILSWSLRFEILPVSEPVFQFEEFELHCGRFQLLRKGRPLRVEPKPLELLILLVSQKGHLVSRREIVEKLWEKDVFVDTDHSINTAIRKLRHLLSGNTNRQRDQQANACRRRLIGMQRLSAPVRCDSPKRQDQRLE